MEEKINLRSTLHFIERWQLSIVLLICAVGILVVISFKLVDHHGVGQGQAIKQTSVSGLKVKAGSSSVLSGSTLTADSPPASVNASVQSPYNPDGISGRPIQSNVNINDPSLSNNPLIESLLVGQP